MYWLRRMFLWTLPSTTTSQDLDDIEGTVTLLAAVPATVRKYYDRRSDYAAKFPSTLPATQDRVFPVLDYQSGCENVSPEEFVVRFVELPGRTAEYSHRTD